MQSLFHIDDKEIMLDNAASTPPFKSVAEKINKALFSYGSVHRGFGPRSNASTELYEESRDFLLRKMNAKENHSLFFTANTTDGINRVALMLLEEKEKTGRDIIIVSEFEHSANLLPFIDKFNIYKIPVNNIGDSFKVDLNVLEETLRLYKDKILAVSLAGASNVSGAILPIKTVRNIINDICPDVYFIIDASQYAPHHTIDLNDADVFVFSGHKMYAPYGIGVVAGDKKLFANMRYSFKGGGDVEFITCEDVPIYKKVPFNQEIGTPNFVGAIAIAESFRIIYDEIGMETVDSYEKKVFEELKKVLQGFPFIHPLVLHSPIAIITIDKPDQEIAEFFNKRNINARMGHFCVFRFIEKIKNITDYGDISQYNAIRLSLGLPTTVKQISMLNEDFLKWK